MSLTVAQLTTPITRAEQLQFLIDDLTVLGFPATSWQSGSIQNTMIRVFSRVWADMSETVKQIAEFGFNDSSTGPALTVYARSHYQNTRYAASKASGPFRFTNTGTTPHVVTVGQLLITTTQTGVQFSNTQAGTIPAGGFVDLTVQAVRGGSAGNISASDPLLLATSLAGVTVAPVVGSWPTASGADAESDTGLRLRNSTKWARMSVELIRDSYMNIALEADPNIRKVFVDDENPRGAGTVDVYIAGDTTALTAGGGEEQAAQNAFAAVAFQTGAYPPDADSRVVVDVAPFVDLDLVGNVYFDGGYTAVAVTLNVYAALEAFLKTIPIGGFSYPGLPHTIPLNEIEFAIRSAKGVKTVTLTTPATNVTVPGFGVLREGNWLGLTYVPVF